MAELTTKWLGSKWPGRDKWRSDGAAAGAGQLVARLRRDGVLLYFRHTPIPGEKREAAVPLGPYDEKGVTGLSLTAARAKAAELAALYRAGHTDLNAHLARERAAAERERVAAEAAAREAAERAQRGTLRQLMVAYVEHLKSGGKRSWRDAESIFSVHVREAAPDLLGKRAAEVTVEEAVDLISRVVAAGKGRTASKLRSCLRAAYQLAIAAKTDPTAPPELRTFGVSVNPIASVGALSKFNRVRDRHLSAPELGAFLRRIEAMEEGVPKDALQLGLLLGGQRPMQLLRLQPGDCDLTAGTVVLHDGKGKRAQPRRHVLPLVKEAKEILKRRLDALGEGEPVLSTDGEHSMRIETLGTVVTDLVDEMLTATPPEAAERFQLRDLRRTCETMLAGLKISSDVRAQLQSHGLGGIQQRHYDRHDYMLEKKQALEKWARYLDKLKKGETAHVISIGKGKASKPNRLNA